MKTILEKMLPRFAPSNDAGGGDAEAAASGAGSETSDAGADASASEGTGTSDSSSQDGSGDASSGDGDSSSRTVSAATPEPAPPSEDWRDKRIAKLTAKLKEAHEAKPVTPAQAADPNAPLDPNVDFNRRVQEAAAQQRALETFNDKCNKAAADGKQKFGEVEFSSALNRLRSLVDQHDPKEVANYNTLVQAAIETGAPEDLIFALGNDPTKALGVLEMSPIKMGIELAKMAITPSAEPDAVSALAKPIRPIGTAASDSRNPVDPTDASRSDSLSTAEWMKRREAQVAASSGRR